MKKFMVIEYLIDIISKNAIKFGIISVYLR